MKKTVTVSKINLSSYNKLVSLGYIVNVVSQSPDALPFANYEYRRPINPRDTVTHVKWVKTLPNSSECTHGRWKCEHCDKPW